MRNLAIYMRKLDREETFASKKDAQLSKTTSKNEIFETSRNYQTFNNSSR